ncbi:MAG: site-2 protease family protein [Methanobacterium sp.]|uniref:site-2 protease family protein n=1 Tax=Methanobacterium sp. TaxID=2164 RepID=UPI003D64FC8A|nr:site-2 protease family protein [Methanobacterium sp.]
MVKFTANEIRDIIISMFVISFAFALLLSGSNINTAISLIPIMLIVVGFAFVFHELAHKFVAIRYGYWAEYKMWIEGLIFALITAYFGFVFAAPGAVYIHGEKISKEENGKISIAGSITNIIFALIFLLIIKISGQLYYWAFMGMFINGFFAFFNQLPIMGLDGSKVIKWNPFAWIIVVLVSLGFVAIGYFPSLLKLIL